MPVEEFSEVCNELLYQAASVLLPGKKSFLGLFSSVSPGLEHWKSCHCLLSSLTTFEIGTGEYSPLGG